MKLIGMLLLGVLALQADEQVILLYVPDMT